jgi:hypothetical protein
MRVGRALRFCGRGICTALPSDILPCLGFTDDVSGIGRCEGSRVKSPPTHSRPACVWVGQARLPVCARRMRGLSTATPIHCCVCTVARALARGQSAAHLCQRVPVYISLPLNRYPTWVVKLTWGYPPLRATWGIGVGLLLHRRVRRLSVLTVL